MAHEGYLLFPRSNNEFLEQSSPLVVKLWIWLLAKANWKDRDQLKRGQLVTTIAAMREAMSHSAGWKKIVPTEDQIRSAYGHLTHTARITTRKTTRGIVITIVNYDIYNDHAAYASHTEDHMEGARHPAATPHDTESIKHRKQKTPLLGANGHQTQKAAFEKTALPDFLPEADWEAFVAHRQEIKKPMSESAKVRMLNQIIKFHAAGHNIPAMIDTAIRKGWQDLYVEQKQAIIGGKRQSYVPSSGDWT